jgi:hypothetical protein
MSLLITPCHGRVLALRGPVIDVTFDTGPLPPIQEALQVDWDQPGPLIAEVQGHLDYTTVRAVALQPTAGLRRGSAVRATGPITMPEPISIRGQAGRGHEAGTGGKSSRLRPVRLRGTEKRHKAFQMSHAEVGFARSSLTSRGGHVVRNS